MTRRTVQLEEAFKARCERLASLTFVGTQSVDQTSTYRLAMFQDSGGTKTSFCLKPGQSLGDALQQVDERFGKAQHKTAVLTDSSVRPLTDEPGQ